MPGIADKETQAIIRNRVLAAVERGALPEADTDDAIQELNLALLSLMAGGCAYDPHKSEWHTWVAATADAKLKNLCEKMQRQKRGGGKGAFSLNDVLANEEEGHEVLIVDTIDTNAHAARLSLRERDTNVKTPKIPAPPQGIDSIRLSVEAQEALAHATPLQIQVAKALTIGLGELEIARELGTTRKAIRCELARLREAFQAAGFDLGRISAVTAETIRAKYPPSEKATNAKPKGKSKRAGATQANAA